MQKILIHTELCFDIYRNTRKNASLLTELTWKCNRATLGYSLAYSHDRPPLPLCISWACDHRLTGGCIKRGKRPWNILRL